MAHKLIAIASMSVLLATYVQAAPVCNVTCGNEPAKGIRLGEALLCHGGTIDCWPNGVDIMRLHED